MKMTLRAGTILLSQTLMMDSNIVYAGIPPTSDAVDACSAAKEAVKPSSNSEPKALNGWFAYLVAALLAVIGCKE